MPIVHLLDYVAGNVRSLVNAIEKIGYTIEWVKSPADIVKAEVKTLTSRGSRLVMAPC
jgi:glutamine amidotransferase/cyclase